MGLNLDPDLHPNPNPNPNPEQAKEKRVELIGESVLRRMIQRGLARGWTAWHAQWARAARQKRMLAAAGSRLRRPKLTACFGNWRTDWEAEMMARRGKGHARLLEESEGTKRELEAQLVRARLDLHPMSSASSPTTARPPPPAPLRPPAQVRQKEEHATQLAAAAEARERLEAQLRAMGVQVEDAQQARSRPISRVLTPPPAAPARARSPYFSSRSRGRRPCARRRR